MIVVLDASAAYDLLTQGRCEPQIVGARDILAPDLIVSDVLNARWKTARSGAAVPDIKTTIEFFSRLTLVPAISYAEAAASLAGRLDHPVYDCLYVAVAQLEKAKLLTLDRRLLAKLRESRMTKVIRCV